MVEDTSGPDRDCDSELSGEVDSDEDECKDGERGRPPGMVTGSEPPSDLGPAEGRTLSGRGRGQATKDSGQSPVPWTPEGMVTPPAHQKR